MLNLLIAIMGDTYDRVQEVAVEAQAKEILKQIQAMDKNYRLTNEKLVKLNEI